MRLDKQQDELEFVREARSRMASQVNTVLERSEHLEAQVAALEGQRDNMLHDLQKAAELQVASTHH